MRPAHFQITPGATIKRVEDESNPPLVLRQANPDDLSDCKMFFRSWDVFCSDTWIAAE